MPSRRSTHPPAEAERIRRAARRQTARRIHGANSLIGRSEIGRQWTRVGTRTESGRSTGDQRDRTARWAATRETEAVDGARARACAAQLASAAGTGTGNSSSNNGDK